MLCVWMWILRYILAHYVVAEFRSKGSSSFTHVKFNTGVEDLISFVLNSMFAWAVIGCLYYALNTLEDAPGSHQ